MPTDASLVVRDYKPADSAACLQLEISGSELRGAGGLLEVAFWHHNEFDAKSRQFRSHVLLVCEDPAAGAICGVIAMVIKRLCVHGEEVLCGYVFDLRVDYAYRRRGIGGSLAREAEARAAAMGVQYFYLTVNGTNDKAHRLYKSLGWVHASHRKLHVSPLVLAPAAARADRAAAAAGGGVRQLGTEEALELVSRYYAKRDLGLSRAEFEHLFASHSYLTTFFATDAPAGTDGASSAALVLWHGSKLTGIKPIRVGLHASTWAKLAPLAPAAFAAVLAGALGLLWTGAAASLFSHLACVATALVVIATFALYQWATSRTAFRARAFAPVAEGPAWEPLMRAVYAAARKEARERGFGILLANLDIDSPVVHCLCGKTKTSNIGSPPAFWHKKLGGGAPLEQLAPDSFFDPRDI